METIKIAFNYRNSIENIDFDKCTKSIRVLSDTFCICIHETDSNETYLINQYQIPNNITENEYIAYVSEANNQLSIECKTNIFYVYTKINTQIPSDYYAKEGDKAILTLLTSKGHDYIPLSETIDFYNFTNLSACNASLFSKIQEHFADFKVKTTISSLFSMLINYNESEKKVLIFVEKMHFTILAAEKNYFLGANGFGFVNEADFTYYTMNFIRKIFIKTNDIQIIICGNIEERSPIFQSLKKYFNQTCILQAKNETKINHYHYYCDIF
jgi:hypothetical protein